MTHTTNDAPVTVEQCDRLREALAKASPLPWRIDHAANGGGNVQSTTGPVARTTWFGNTHKEAMRDYANGELIVAAVNALPGLLAALASAPAGDGDTSRGKVDLSALHHAERLLGADNAVEKIMTQSDEQLVADAMKVMSAQAVKVAIRGWLDADDASHWGAFETALDAAINDTPERAMIVAMLRADAETMRTNATAYSEESPTDARALHEVATTLNFKAAQIERGDHLDAEPASAPAEDGVEDARAIILQHSEKWVAEYVEREGELPDTMVFRFPFVEKLLAAALARPRAAVGEQSREAIARAAADGCNADYPEGVRSRGSGKWHCAYDGAMRALALQSPPAKVEG